MAVVLAGPAARPSFGGVTGACHVSPVVADVERSVRFYRDALGLEVSPIERTPSAVGGGGTRSVVARIAGARCGIELAEFAGDRTAVRFDMQDPGAITLILLVRDIDAALATAREAGAGIATSGGAPVFPAPASKTRAVIVRDPDGHFVEFAQLAAPPATAPSSNVYDLRLRVTVADLDQAIGYYAGMGIAIPPGPFATSRGVMAMMGLPDSAEYRLGTVTIPGSVLIFELLEIRGLPRTTRRPRLQDPGACQLRLIVDDAKLPTGPVRDPNNLFLVLQRS